MITLIKNKEGLAAPLLFSALGLAAYGSARASTTIWLLSLTLLWLGARFVSSTVPARGVTLLGLSVYGLGAWIVASNLFINPSYTSAAPYQAAFLVGGFLLGRRAGVAATPLLFAVALAFSAGIAVWALYQWSMLAALRAHSIFITPGTLGAVTNLVLAPALVIYVLQEDRRRLLPCILVLAAALSVAQSRGAWIALAAGAGFAWFLAWRARLPINRLRVATALLVIVAATATSWNIASNVIDPTGSVLPMEETKSLIHRRALYELALHGITASSWLFGSGYHTFYYLVESSRLTVPVFRDISTYFVHNDYLQFLLELGTPGLLGMLGVALLPVAYAWRTIANSTLAHRAQTVLIALAGATASMAVHALGDFPFYIPACVLLYGTALGILDTLFMQSGKPRVLHAPRALQGPALRRAITAGAGTVAAWLLVVPAAAEAAAEYGVRNWHSGRGKEAAWAFEAARRIDARDWRYHWYAGQFWMAQASSLSDPAAAALADKALAKGMAANPLEVRPVLDRMALHHKFRRLLASPVPPATLLEWADRAVRLAPADENVRSERNMVVLRFGSTDGTRPK